MTSRSPLVSISEHESTPVCAYRLIEQRSNETCLETELYRTPLYLIDEGIIGDTARGIGRLGAEGVRGAGRLAGSAVSGVGGLAAKGVAGVAKGVAGGIGGLARGVVGAKGSGAMHKLGSFARKHPGAAAAGLAGAALGGPVGAAIGAAGAKGVGAAYKAYKDWKARGASEKVKADKATADAAGQPYVAPEQGPTTLGGKLHQWHAGRKAKQQAAAQAHAAQAAATARAAIPAPTLVPKPIPAPTPAPEPIPAPTLVPNPAIQKKKQAAADAMKVAAGAPEREGPVGKGKAPEQLKARQARADALTLRRTGSGDEVAAADAAADASKVSDRPNTPEQHKAAVDAYRSKQALKKRQFRPPPTSGGPPPTGNAPPPPVAPEPPAASPEEPSVVGRPTGPGQGKPVNTPKGHSSNYLSTLSAGPDPAGPSRPMPAFKPMPGPAATSPQGGPSDKHFAIRDMARKFKARGGAPLSPADANAAIAAKHKAEQPQSQPAGGGTSGGGKTGRPKVRNVEKQPDTDANREAVKADPGKEIKSGTRGTLYVGSTSESLARERRFLLTADYKLLDV